MNPLLWFLACALLLALAYGLRPRAGEPERPDDLVPSDDELPRLNPRPLRRRRPIPFPKKFSAKFRSRKGRK